MKRVVMMALLVVMCLSVVGSAMAQKREINPDPTPFEQPSVLTVGDRGDSNGSVEGWHMWLDIVCKGDYFIIIEINDDGEEEVVDGDCEEWAELG